MKVEEKFDKDKFFTLLEDYGFNPKSNNNNIHIQLRHKKYSADIWPTTRKMWLTLDNKKYTFAGIFEIMAQILALSYIDEE